jgi:hypothetical protein
VSYCLNIVAATVTLGVSHGAPLFRVIDFIWKDINDISLKPQKTCGFATYLMFMIEDVTNRIFPKDGFHMPIRHIPPSLRSILFV